MIVVMLFRSLQRNMDMFSWKRDGLVSDHRGAGNLITTGMLLHSGFGNMDYLQI